MTNFALAHLCRLFIVELMRRLNIIDGVHPLYLLICHYDNTRVELIVENVIAITTRDVDYLLTIMTGFVNTSLCMLCERHFCRW